MFKTIIDFNIASLTKNYRNEIKELLKEKFDKHYKSFSTKNTKGGFTATLLTELYRDMAIEHNNDLRSFLCSFKSRYKTEIRDVIIKRKVYNDKNELIQDGPKITILYVAQGV